MEDLALSAAGRGRKMRKESLPSRGPESSCREDKGLNLLEDPEPKSLKSSVVVKGRSSPFYLGAVQLILNSPGKGAFERGLRG